jgi:hypothetical protein
MRLFFIIPFCFFILIAGAQKPGRMAKYTGKYEANSMVVQVTILNGSLILVVAGAPLQRMVPAGTNTFKSNTFSDELFVFVEKDGKIEEMLSQRAGQSVALKKISDMPDDFNKSDSVLELRKSSRHFRFLYSKIDSGSVERIAAKLESDYRRILGDFKIRKLPITTVRIYPDRESFRQGINFPNAPDDILATAFGKDDFRMMSPNIADTDSAMLIQHITHEFTHCVHLNIDYSPNNPRWLWEGVAMFESGWFFDPNEMDIVKNRNFPPLSNLNNGMEYMLGYVIIEAIKANWGFDTVINLIRKRGDVQAVLKLSQDMFEKKVYDYIYKKYIDK